MSSTDNDKDKDFVLSSDYNNHEISPTSEKEYYSTGNNSFQRTSAKHFLFAVVGFLILIALSLIVLFRSYNLAEKVQLSALESRLEQLENKLVALEKDDKVLSRPGVSAKQLRLLGEKFDRLESSVAARIDNMIKNLSNLQPKPTPTASQKAPVTQPVKTTKKEIKPKIHTVIEGETLYRISRRYGLTIDQLRQYNKLGAAASIYPGQELKLTPPKSN